MRYVCSRCGRDASDQSDYVKNLRERIAELTEEVNQMRRALLPHKGSYQSFSPMQSIILRTIAMGKGVPVSAQRIHLALYPHGETETDRSLRVMVNRLRHHGLPIFTRQRFGYFMEEQVCEAILANEKVRGVIYPLDVKAGKKLDRKLGEKRLAEIRDSSESMMAMAIRHQISLRQVKVIRSNRAERTHESQS